MRTSVGNLKPRADNYPELICYAWRNGIGKDVDSGQTGITRTGRMWSVWRNGFCMLTTALGSPIGGGVGESEAEPWQIITDTYTPPGASCPCTYAMPVNTRASRASAWREPCPTCWTLDRCYWEAKDGKR